MERLGSRNVVYFDSLPIFFGEYRMGYAGRSENCGNILKTLTQGVASFMNVVPLLFCDGSANVISVYLSLVE